MTKKGLNQFRGRLSPDQVAQGMNVAERNACRLLADAQLLLGAGRFPSAASIAVLSLEESGKVSILRELALARSDDEAKDAWSSYRSHTKKNVTWLLPELIANGARELEDLRPLMDPTAEHPHVLDQLKQLGFYTDCLGQVHWSEPSSVIDEELARTLVRTAGLLARQASHTPREIALWVEHIGPVWKGEMPWMKTALSNWYQAMRAEGLHAGDEKAENAFIWGPRSEP
jgi:AbiV family abortive infection protein